jgi:FdhD protein
VGTSGLVLAGGASRRFGRDKRTVRVDGRHLVERAVAAVAAVTDDVLVAVAVDRPLPGEVRLPPGTRTVTDVVGHAGPLAGLVAGLAAASADVVVVLGGDHGWADAATLARLRDRLLDDEELDAVVVEAGGRRQPLAAAYRRRVGPVALHRLEAGDARVLGLLDHLRVATESGPGAERTARDVDVPDDLDHTARTSAVRVTTLDADGHARREVFDHLAGEEPLRILAAGPGQEPVEVATTMRTPGHELELAVGLLHAEGLLRPGDVTGSRIGDALHEACPEDTIVVELRQPLDPERLAHRHAPATASCGVCGRATIDDLLDRVTPLHDRGPTVPWGLVAGLPGGLRAEQRTFEATGGLHATGIARADGRLVTVREDVGRHNALDAAVGVHVLAGEVPLTDHLVVLSGRVGFELVQKVAVAGATIVVAVGAPSDLAVRTAEAAGITLCGFVRAGAGNVYSHPHRVQGEAR